MLPKELRYVISLVLGSIRSIPHTLLLDRDALGEAILRSCEISLTLATSLRKVRLGFLALITFFRFPLGLVPVLFLGTLTFIDSFEAILRFFLRGLPIGFLDPALRLEPFVGTIFSVPSPLL